jgi:hypothetical protein
LLVCLSKLLFALSAERKQAAYCWRAFAL